MRYDVVVIGAGTAGIPCAVEAANAGARVLLVEKTGQVGGTLHVSGGHVSAAGTRRQAAQGITDSPDEHYADIQRISRGTAPPAITRLAVDEAAGAVDWLEDHGFAFSPGTPRIVYGHEPYARPRTYYGPQAGRSVLAVLQSVLDARVRAGGVDVWLDSPVASLVAAGDRVTGVQVHRAGQAAAVHAEAVVLATGGYGAAREMFAAFHDAPLVTAAMPSSTGDGLRMAQQLGAAIVGAQDYLPSFGGLPDVADTGRVYWPDRPILVVEERVPWEIYVDRDGRRFVAEDLPSIDAKERELVRLPDHTFFTVFDDRAVDASTPMIEGWTADDVRQRANQRPGIFAAPTLRELAQVAGIDAAGLEHSVTSYNAMVERGADPDFGRQVFPAPIVQPPFYAMRNHGITLITFAGVAVDTSFAVHRADGRRIEGLYAVGEVIGAAAAMGNAFCSGMLITPAIAFGRRLGGRLGAAVARSAAGRGDHLL